MPYSLHFDSGHRVLLITIGGVLTRAEYLAGYDAGMEFLARHGPCSLISDYTGVERIDTPPGFAREISELRPLVPPGTKRVIVAPQPAIYGSARMASTLREGTGSEIVVYRTLAEACAGLGIASPDFQPVA